MNWFVHGLSDELGPVCIMTAMGEPWGHMHQPYATGMAWEAWYKGKYCRVLMAGLATVAPGLPSHPCCVWLLHVTPRFAYGGHDTQGPEFITQPMQEPVYLVHRMHEWKVLSVSRASSNWKSCCLERMCASSLSSRGGGVARAGTGGGWEPEAPKAPAGAPSEGKTLALVDDGPEVASRRHQQQHHSEGGLYRRRL